MAVQHRCPHCTSRNTRLVRSKNRPGDRDKLERYCFCRECGEHFRITLKEERQATTERHAVSM